MDKIVDSNLVIYSSQSLFSYLRPIIYSKEASISEITRLETLGFTRLETLDKRYFESLFAVCNLLPINTLIINEAIHLRSIKRMSVGDAIIAATAIIHNLTLYTHNTQDFDWIDNLKIIDPF